MSCSTSLPFLLLAPLLGLLSLLLAVNVLWLAPLAALLSVLCCARRRVAVAQGARVLVTGGSSGIGLAVAKRCALEGAKHVTLVGRNEERLATAKQEVIAAGAGVVCEVATVSLDLRQASQEEVAATLGELARSADLLVCSAGDSGQPETLEKITEESWHAQFELNVMGCVKATNAVLPGMKQRKKGAICLVGSMASQTGIYGLSAYAASKFGLRGFAEVLRMELVATSITLNLACPPDTDTPMLARENETKPLITQEISKGSGLWTADAVAAGILQGLDRGEYITGFGMDGFMLNIASGGMNPVGSPLSLVMEVLLMPLFRLIAVWYIRSFDNIVRRFNQNETSGHE